MFDDIEGLCTKITAGMQVTAVTVATLAPSQDTETLTRALASIEQVRRAADAAQLAVIRELARRGQEEGPDGMLVETREPPGTVADLAVDSIAMTLDCTAHEARTRTTLAARLEPHLDPLLGPLMDGAVPERTLRLVAEETEDASPEGVAAVVEHVLAHKRGTEIPRIVALDRHDLAQACRRVLERTNPGWREQRAATNRATKTDVRAYPGRLGTTELVATLPSEVALALMRTVDDLATRRRSDNPELRAGAARAQALTDLALRGVETTTHVTLGLTLVHGPDGSAVDSCEGGSGSDDDLVPMGRTHAPWLGGVEVPRIGWIPGSVVQTLTERLDSRVTRALLDPDEGTVMETSTTGYVPPPSIKRLVQLRDTRCRMWGCTRPAAACDLDHATPYPEGETKGANLSALCRHHHRVKHAPGWSHTLDADGVTTWTAPGGTSRLTWPTEHAPVDVGRLLVDAAPSVVSRAEPEAVSRSVNPGPAGEPPF